MTLRIDREPKQTAAACKTASLSRQGREITAFVDLFLKFTIKEVIVRRE